MIKSKIIIDVDTEREQKIVIGHATGEEPKTPEEINTLIFNDISCVFESFCMLIHMADINGYGKKAEYIKTAVDHLNKMLEEK